MTDSTSNLPRWDMTPIFPGLDSPEFDRAREKLDRDVADLAAFFDAHGVDARPAAPLDNATVALGEAAISRLNAVFDAAQIIGSYLEAFVTTDSRDDLAQARLSDFEQVRARLSLLDTRFTAWVGSLDVEALAARSGAARDHAYALHRANDAAKRLMSPVEEALATDMSVTGAFAWEKLHGNVSSQIMVPVERGGAIAELPMTVIRNLASEPDRDLRRRAYEAEVAAWSRWSVPLAAALNGVKGEVALLARRRGWGSALDTALFDNGIDRPVLDAMLGAMREYFPAFRRYLKAKARALGVDTLAWYDLFAPVGADESDWPFDRAMDFVVQQYGKFSPRMRGLAERALRERWIDAEPRPGKRGGAYCTEIKGDVSRVFTNYQPTLGGVTTLAHELGHAYHNLCLADRTPLQRRTPMTLAETASTFAETIVLRAALGQASPAEQLAILEEDLQGATQIVVDISSRFIFESALFERRAARELSVDELNSLMLGAQRDTYGDGLDGSKLHAYMWAVKPHYYGATLQFYNFPYAFGQLFGLGLYARYLAEPDAFRASYDDLLASTGLADPATLAGRFGIDIRDAAFWRSSLKIIEGNVERYESLVGSQA